MTLLLLAVYLNGRSFQLLPERHKEHPTSSKLNTANQLQKVRLNKNNYRSPRSRSHRPP